jgi:hypothetical protein
MIYRGPGFLAVVLLGSSPTPFPLRKFAEIFVIQGAPPVSTTPAANFSTSFASLVDTGSKLPPVSMTPAANFHRFRLHLWQTMGAIIKLLTT